jgi:hypothetical protein
MSESTSDLLMTQTPEHNATMTAEQPSAAAEPARSTETSATTRAGTKIDQAALQVALATSYVGKGFLRFAARIREELSDLWAEAQSIRRGDKS